MGSRGPQPMSPALMALKGHRPSRIRKAEAAAAGTPTKLDADRPPLPVDPPPSLRGEHERLCWRTIAEGQLALSLGPGLFIGETERLLVEVACRKYEIWVLAGRALDRRRAEITAELGEGSDDLALFTLTKDGEKVEAPEVLVERKASQELIRALTAMGLPRKYPQLLARLSSESAAGDRMAMELLR